MVGDAVGRLSLAFLDGPLIRRLTLFLFLLAAASPLVAVELTLPCEEGSLRFLVIGDSGTGKAPQYKLAEVMAEAHSRCEFSIALMLGDNLYGGESERDFIRKFEEPYRALLVKGVRFYASLGNHDKPNQRYYKLFNMDGKRFYSFSPHKDVRFYGLDSTYLDPEQVSWLEKELKQSDSKWKISFFHHPIYSSGRRHGPSMALRRSLEPVFMQNGIDVVFSGHEHFYERLKPQNGIHYFISGGAGKVRRGNIRPTENTAAGYDRGLHFMLVEIDGDQMYYQAIAANGETVDSGVIRDGNGKVATAASP